MAVHFAAVSRLSSHHQRGIAVKGDKADKAAAP